MFSNSTTHPDFWSGAFWGFVAGVFAITFVASLVAAKIFQRNDIYDVDHWKLNVKVPFTTTWMNMGYWTTADGQPIHDFEQACRALRHQVLMASGVLNADKTSSKLAILDLGIGCGDQSLELARLIHESHWTEYRYVGLTLNETQFRLAAQQPCSKFQKTNPAHGSIQVFQADAARPNNWSPDVKAAIEALGDNKHEARDLDASFMAFDLILNDKASSLNRLWVKLISIAMKCPIRTFVTEAEYKTQLMQAGYDKREIRMQDVTRHVFSGLVSHINKQEAILKPQATKWIETCVLEHADCSGQKIVLIYTTEDSLEAPKYAALSYCWGSGGQSLVLTQTNLQEWSYEGICTDLLPATIRDAINVTHSLGIPYLWVDSMCIVQDSREDKERELKKMHLVYENCYVAICVANRESGDGFLDQTTTNVCGKPLGFQVACTLPDGQIGTLVISITEHFQPNEDEINQRAWTLQERLLAPRTLYYTNDPSLLYWDCDSLLERHDSQNTTDLELSRSHEWSMGRLRAEVAAPKHHREEEPSTFDDEIIDKVMLEWKQIVCDYSKRVISHDEDRLNAIASLAAKFHTALPLDYIYIAGTWLDPARGYREFIHNLYWAVCWGEARPTSEYVSPSWSWASVHGEIRGEPGWSTSKEPQCTLIDCRWELASLELPYGRVRPGAWPKWDFAEDGIDETICRRLLSGQRIH
ncbi:hypothetical protein CcaCcLH18_00409 [Colletotrichum camelliae]|nr:hypothetical protein CcaCcLH18_00409 [Colletotrichum camelliae]